jgi:hypothetical protein
LVSDKSLPLQNHNRVTVSIPSLDDYKLPSIDSGSYLITPVAFTNCIKKESIMINDTKSAVVQMEANVLAELLTEVKETIASNINLNVLVSKKQVYGIVDLWNMRRNCRMAFSRRSQRAY